MPIVNIYGTNVTIPELNDGYIEDWGTSVAEEQYWRRKEMPKFFDLVEYDIDGNALLTNQQREYAMEEVRRCKEGFWFYNNGVKTYITGKNYFYLQYWKLEDDVYPDFRDVDRRYFLFLNHWENTSWCLGISRGKKRREGASSQATSNLIYECIFFKNSFCGLTSKTQIDAKNTFTNMVAFGYRQLPVFLKPKQLNNKDSVTELVFAHKSVQIKGAKGSVVDSDTGHRSKVDYRAPSKNAYDSGRISRILIDEAAKWPAEVPASEFLAIVSKTMIKGAKRVGFAECPSTVNEMTKGGGAEFKKIWEAADQTKYERTPNRFVRYFSPAYEGYVGFIDKYGNSVIEAPTEQQYRYLVDMFVGVGDLTEEDIKLGSREYLLRKRAQLEGTSLEEEIRMNPFDEKEMFQSSLNGCIYNSFKINQQIDALSWGEPITEKGNLVWENGHEYYKEEKFPNGEIEMKPSKLIWVANPNGRYSKLKGWLPKEMNNIFIRNGNFTPNGNFAIRIGCDPFKYDKTKDASRRSNCAAYAYQLADPLDEQCEYNDCFVMEYINRPPTSDIAYEDILKMAWFCGCQVLFERNVDNWKKFFQYKKCSQFLMWLPTEVEPGIYEDVKWNTVQDICDQTESYIERSCHKVPFPNVLGDKQGWLGFEVGDTQKYDAAMAAGYALIAAKQKRYIKQESFSKNIENILPYNKAV